MIQANAVGRFVLHADLGLDRISVWKFDERRGVLTPNEPLAVTLPPGDGPRHFHLHPNGRWFYSIQEEGSTIVLFDYDATTGRLARRQTISTLPPVFGGSNVCSESLVSADGRFVYAGNQLHDSIGIFFVGPKGDLTYVEEEWTRGIIPAASISISPVSSSAVATSAATTLSPSRWIARPPASSSLAITPPVGNPSSIVFLDVTQMR
jgi:6-phosphogluconolactonase (cycloisomerase 2 family)